LGFISDEFASFEDFKFRIESISGIFSFKMKYFIFSKALDGILIG